jgi:Flp pilus assembly protein protease CpaA
VVALIVWLGLLGEGDAFLLAAIGAWIDWQFALATVFWTSLVGAALAQSS